MPVLVLENGTNWCYIGPMQTQTSQIKLTLPVHLKDFLQSKAVRLGLPLASFIRYVLIKEVETEGYPVFQASESTEKAYQGALRDYKEGKTVKVKDIDKFFQRL